MIAVALVFLIIRPFILQAFYIPSPSMEPTLLGKDNSGDRILVNKFEYRTEKPHRDDVVVFSGTRLPQLSRTCRQTPSSSSGLIALPRRPAGSP